MTTKILINGDMHDEGTAKISVLDRGFLFGDSVYEVMRTYDGVPFSLDLHLQRLQRSAALIAMDLPVEQSVLIDEIEQTIRAAANEESYVRVIVTRGSGPIALDTDLASNPCRVIIVRPLECPSPELYRQGAKVAMVSVGLTMNQALGAGAKSSNYLTNLLALRMARQQNAHEVIMVDGQGRIAEGSTSNVFIVKDGTLLTPPLGVGILEGITRRKVIHLAETLAISCRETELRGIDLETADEMFLTSTLREILPVTALGNQSVGQGVPGPVTAQLRSSFDVLVGRQSK